MICKIFGHAEMIYGPWFRGGGLVGPCKSRDETCSRCWKTWNFWTTDLKAE